MQPTDLLRQTASDGSDNERAVSPVIGVILMVAITVILAAIIGTFVLGLGEQVQSNSPNAGFGFDYEAGTTGADCSLGSDGQLTINHQSGESVDPVTMNVTDADGNSAPWDGTSDGTCAVTSGDVAAGSTMTVDVDSDDTIRVIWQENDQSATLGDYDAPDA